MALKFNPFTGTLDQTGSGGGGASYIDGEVQNFSALPETLGTPAVDSAYLVREPEGTWLLARKPAGIYIRTANTGTRADDWTHASAFPDVFSDAAFTVYSDGDSTKNLQLSLSGLTTGTTRTLTVPDASGTLALVGDAPSSHTHGSITNDGKVGSTAGLPLVTTTAGAVTTLALGTANQVLRVNSGATGVEFGAGFDAASPPAIGNTTPNTLAGTELALHDGSDTGTFVAASKLTANRTYDLPDRSGTMVVSDTSAGSGSDVVNNIVSLTQAEYAAIVSPDAATLFLITDP